MQCFFLTPQKLPAIARRLVSIHSGLGERRTSQCHKTCFCSTKILFLKHGPRFAVKNTARLIFAELLGPCSLGYPFFVLCWWRFFLCSIGGHYFPLLVVVDHFSRALLVGIFSVPCWWAIFCSAAPAVLVVSAFWQLVRVLGRIGQGGFCAKMTIGE